jgi:SAM-dependent methyltransferase
MTRDQSEVKRDQASLDPLVYQALHTGTLGDIAFYCDLVHQWMQKYKRNNPLNERRPWVLELGCGSGRLAIPLAEAGAKIIGIDDHEGLLKRAQIQLTHRCAELSEDEAVTLSSRIDLRCQDFTELSHQLFPHITRGFDLILLPYNGLYCLLDEDTQIELIKTACQLLAPEGSMWIDGYALPDPEEYTYESEEDYAPLTVIEVPPAQGDHDSNLRELGVEELDRFNLAEQRLDICYRYRAAPESQHQEPLHGQREVIQHRYLYPWQLQDLCTRAQSQLVALYADFDEEIEVSSDLRDLPWGIELEHWVARVQPRDLNT